MINKLLSIGVFLCLALPAAGEETPAPVCRATPEALALDFWVGDYDVYSNDAARTLLGQNHIERILSGCAIIENWASVQGYEGKSLFTFDARANTWSQVWVTGDTSQPWGLKVKALVGISGDGSVRFQSTQVLEGGVSYLDRTILTPLEDGAFRQLIEISSDNGETWQVTFDGLYVPMGD